MYFVFLFSFINNDFLMSLCICTGVKQNRPSCSVKHGGRNKNSEAAAVSVSQKQK